MAHPLLGNLQGPRLPADAEGRVSLPANAPLVEATPMLDWQVEAGAAPPRVSMAHFQILLAFGGRCDLSRIPADVAAARSRSILTACFVQATWVRILVELIDSGLLEALEDCQILDEFKTTMAGLTISRPAQLQITAGDSGANVEPFDVPARPAVPARGYGQGYLGPRRFQDPQLSRFWKHLTSRFS